MCGKASCSPFDAAVVTKGREQLLEKLSASGIGATRQATDEPSSVHFRLVYALLKPFEDPDACATGVRVGVGIWMPRTPRCQRPEAFMAAVKAARSRAVPARGNWPRHVPAELQVVGRAGARCGEGARCFGDRWEGP